MMTIKVFASLCGCSTQTLRYYDKINLLKPIKVDPCSGYRYYTKSQAIDFIKIKNLQSADFTIDEIKSLLTMPDLQVYEAFNRKIAEQSQKLEQIKKIQQSYLAEKNNMEKLIQNVSDYILHAVSNYDVLREFGLTPEEGPAAVAKLKTYLEASTLRHLPAEPDVHMIVNDQVIRGADHIADAFEALKESTYPDTVLLGNKNIRKEGAFTPDNYETVWEYHSWKFVYEFIDDIPELEQGYDYCFYFQLTDDKYSDGLEFPMFMISTMLPRIDADEIAMGCSVERSTDEKNHFSLMRRNQRNLLLPH